MSEPARHQSPAVAELAPPGPRERIEAELRGFLERYREALAACDLDAVAAVYRTPLPVIRPDRLRVVETAAALRVELERILDFYRWCGMTDVRLERLRLDGEERGLWIACLTWVPVDRTGAPIARVSVTYALRLTREDVRIAAVVAHNEERERRPLLRAAALAADPSAASAPADLRAVVSDPAPAAQGGPP